MEHSASELFRKLPFILLTLMIVVGCGSSGSEEEGEPFTRGTGTWSGQMRQLGGVSCGDGSFLGVGSGVPTREISILVIGGDAVGAIASIDFEGCQYIGYRESARTMIFRANGENCTAEEILFEDIRLDSASITIVPRLPENSKAEVCVISEGGDFVKIS